MFNEDSESSFFSLMKEIEKEESGKKTKEKIYSINSLSGEFEFLSTFFERPQTSTFLYEQERDDDGGKEVVSITEEVKSAEHAYQMSRTLNREEQLKIKNCYTPRQARRLGERLVSINDWDSRKLNVMNRVLEDKFAHNIDLKIKLLSLKDINIINNVNWKDEFWGVYQDVGENHIGKLLMSIRDRIINQQGNAEEVLLSFLSKYSLGFIESWLDPNKVYEVNKRKDEDRKEKNLRKNKKKVQ